jgi:hypothetical protein
MTTDTRYQVVERCDQGCEKFMDNEWCRRGDEIMHLANPPTIPPDCPLLKVADMVPRAEVNDLREAAGDYLIASECKLPGESTKKAMDRMHRYADKLRAALAALEK